MLETLLVVPCFDEAKRLPADAFLRFRSKHPEIGFVLVNDGSRDATLERLRALADADAEGFAVVDLPANRGKAEAVRAGTLEALGRGPRYVGFWDADLSTPLAEAPRFAAVLDAEPGVALVLGSRVKMLGHAIERRAVRHYVGRVLATLIGNALELPVYDTQCGAKLLRVTDETRALFDAPFLSRWIFDVELLARFVEARRAEGTGRLAGALRELPLLRWEEVPGSKIRLRDGLVALRDLVRIRRRHRLGRRRS